MDNIENIKTDRLEIERSDSWMWRPDEAKLRDGRDLW